MGGVGKLEADEYEISYLGSLGYESIGWQWQISLEKMEEKLLEIIEKARYTIEKNDISQKTNVLLSCPNNISEEIVGTWGSYIITITEEDEIIIGNKDNPSLWTRKVGKGKIVFDNFILKDKGYEKLGYKDDLYSKGLAEKYFINVLNYLAKFEEYGKGDSEIKLISPINDSLIKILKFSFNSRLPDGSLYTLSIIDISGKTISIKLNQTNFNKKGNKIEANLINSINFSQLANGRYEWNVEGKFNNTNYFSDIDSFTKFERVINETQ